MQIITFTSPGGTPGVIWPALDAQLPEETDAEFMARIMGQMLPPGATDAQITDAGDYVPLPVVTPNPSPREWLERLSSATQQAISQAAIASPTILLWLLKASGSTSIDVTLQETKDGVAALVTAGVLTQEDSVALLA